MALSLTRDEFLERLAERQKLLEVAMAHDLDGSKIPIDLVRGEDGLWHIREPEFTEFVGKLVRAYLVRVIDLAYREE
jgi:hypothetical protein